MNSNLQTEKFVQKNNINFSFQFHTFYLYFVTFYATYFFHICKIAFEFCSLGAAHFFRHILKQNEKPLNA